MSDLANRFTYHPPKDGQPEKYQILREQALEFATAIAYYAPESHEREVALDHVDAAVMFANAAIARHS